MKKIFLYECKIFDADLMVAVGVNRDDILKWVSKNGNAISNRVYKENLTEGFNANCTACLVRLEDEVSNFYILWMNDYNNTWKNYYTLLHEVVHFKQVLFERRSIGKKEVEFEAYFIEDSYRRIIRLLDKYYKK